VASKKQKKKWRQKKKKSGVKKIYVAHFAYEAK
jgi:hypothetical protein